MRRTKKACFEFILPHDARQLRMSVGNYRGKSIACTKIDKNNRAEDNKHLSMAHEHI